MMNLSTKYLTKQNLFIKTLEELLLFQNWSDDLLKETCKECKFDLDYHYVLFPNGLTEVVKFFERSKDKLMFDQLSLMKPKIRIVEKIAEALTIRVKSVNKLVHRRNAIYFSLPNNIVCGTECAWETSDLIWRYAGDRATDFNYYSKRTLLLSVYLSSILFYSNDESEAEKNTEEFIRNTLEKVIKLNKIKQIKLPSLSEIPIVRLFL